MPASYDNKLTVPINLNTHALQKRAREKGKTKACEEVRKGINE